MTPEATKITNPETNEEKSYKFNHHLWSHARWYDPENKQGPRDDFVDQDKLFELIGLPLFESFWADNTNICLFAYGQSGSGKSFSMRFVFLVACFPSTSLKPATQHCYVQPFADLRSSRINIELFLHAVAIAHMYTHAHAAEKLTILRSTASSLGSARW